MAAGSPRKRLWDEVTCSVCLDFFIEPVILDCGHNFCRACIEKCWGDAPTDAPEAAACPQCREKVQRKSLKPNWQLANVVEIAKELSVQQAPERGGWKVCEWHEEPLKLFCKDDEAPICVVCDRSKEHRAHNVVPVHEAAQEYCDWICSCLETLRKEKEKILAYKAEADSESQGLLEQIAAQREKAVVQFKELHQFLEEQEWLLLAQMEEVEMEIAKTREEHATKILEDLSSLEGRIAELEEKLQQSANELVQDIRSTLQRFEEKKFENPVLFSLELKWRIWDFCDTNPFLEHFMKQFKDNLVSGLQLKKANVLLDPDTANPWLVLYEDCKTARFGPKRQVLPNNCERFDKWKCVLGCEGFITGRHFWDVVVGSEGEWSVGVARKSVRRKGKIACGPEEGIWEMGKWDDEYGTTIHSGPLSVKGKLNRIRVSLNYDGGHVTFHDADTAALIFTCSVGPFSGEPLLPYFSMSKGACLTLSP